MIAQDRFVLMTRERISEATRLDAEVNEKVVSGFDVTRLAVSVPNKLSQNDVVF